MPIPIIDKALGLGKSVVDLSKAIVKRKTERERLSHEQREKRHEAEKRKDATPKRDPSDSLGDGTF
jgi:hypothetical protein